MKKSILSFLLLVSGIFAFAQSAASVSPEVYAQVVQSVFEVVTPKQEDKNISYEKELPLDRLSYQERTDKYNSIGSAFLLENGYFYTAAHVLTLFGDTNYTEYFIRNTNGDVFKISKIYSFATDRDFVQFTADGFEFKEGMGLKICKDLQTGSTVFSAGNALGEGVVLRNGAFTSKTPENHEGEWKWLRFSAPASPGNSGGPLITAEGEVAGIITMKSENENLNYALPIEEALNAKENYGLVNSRYYYVMPNIFKERFYNEFKQEIDLPASIAEISGKITPLYKEAVKKAVGNIRKDYAPDMEKGFNKVFGKAEFYFNSYSLGYPHVIYLPNSGKWDYAHPENMNTLALENNGKIVYGAMMNYAFITITKPENVSLADFITNPKQYVEYCLKGADLSRSVGGEQIKITSLGEPCQSDTYTDYYGRTWFVNYFDIKFADSMLVSYALPLPTGIFVFYGTNSKNQITSASYLDMAFVADHIYTSYSGKIKNWKEYLSLPEKIYKKSPSESQIKIELTKKDFTFQSESYKLNIPLEDFNIDNESQVVVTTSFKDSGDKVTTENRMIYIFTDPAKENYKLVVLDDYTKPMDGAVEDTTDYWKKLINKAPPFDSRPYTQKQLTYMYDVIPAENNDEIPGAAEEKALGISEVLAVPPADGLSAADNAADSSAEPQKIHEIIYQISGSTNASDIIEFADAIKAHLEFK